MCSELFLDTLSETVIIKKDSHLVSQYNVIYFLQIAKKSFRL